MLREHNVDYSRMEYHEILNESEHISNIGAPTLRHTNVPLIKQIEFKQVDDIADSDEEDLTPPPIKRTPPISIEEILKSINDEDGDLLHPAPASTKRHQSTLKTLERNNINPKTRYCFFRLSKKNQLQLPLLYLRIQETP